MEITRIKSIRNSRKTRVAAYIRVSTPEDNQDESYEMQEEYYERFIRSNPDWDFAGVYGERISGTHSENRPAFQQIIRDAIDKKIDIIYCKSVSRWARNAVDALESIKYLNGNSVHLVFEQEGIDTRMPGVIFQLTMAAAVAESESESISENMKWVYRNRALRGIYLPTKNRNFGYCTDDYTFRPDENAVYVRRIFEEFVEGKNSVEIARMLNDEGVLTNLGRPFTGDVVRYILKNEIYVGDYQFGKRVSKNIITGLPDEKQVKKYVKNHHEAIISRNLWEKAQARFDAERLEQERRKAKQKRAMYIFMADPKVSTKRVAEQLGITGKEARSIVTSMKNSCVLKKTDEGWTVDTELAQRKYKDE